MRWSNTFIPTLRDDPADAEAVSHKLLVRAGLIRQLIGGHLFAAAARLARALRKIEAIIRDEMDAHRRAGVPAALHAPGGDLGGSGRWDSVGDEMFRLKDRKQARSRPRHDPRGDLHLSIATRDALATARCPQIWYQLQTKFRDEPRPKAGLLRVREFTMKDSYSFDLDQAGLDHAFEQPLRRVSPDLRALRLRAARRSRRRSGAMGGSRVDRVHGDERRGRGLDRVTAAHAATRRTSRRRRRAADAVEDGAGLAARPKHSRRPGVRTIDDLAKLRGRRRGRAPDQDARLRRRRRDDAGAAARRSRARGAEARRWSTGAEDPCGRDRRGDPRGARRVGREASARSASRTSAIIADDGAARPARHDDGRQPGRRSTCAASTSSATSTSTRWLDLREVAAGEAVPAVRRAARRREDDRGRPHLQARHEVQRRSSAPSCRTRRARRCRS